jgi:aspartate aminotransferase
MSIVSSQISGYLEKSSWIRRMFEEGIQLKQKFGEDAVCDFSLGNPDVPPPALAGDALKELAETVSRPFSLGYMPNGGFMWAREELAAHLAKEQKAKVTGQHVILSCGAAGGINALFRAVLDPGDEVIAIAPFFVEYSFYVENHSGVLRAVKSKPDTFALDIAAIEAAITPKTRAVIVNSPNNPTGAIYNEDELKQLSAVLLDASKKRNRPIFLVSDEPYRFLAFDGAVVPPVLPLYPYGIVIGSFSKNLSLAGERLGYVAISPLMDDKAMQMLGASIIMCNRILGFVNPPIVGQHIMKKTLQTMVDPNIYAARRNTMAKALKDAGYEFHMPQGAFYFFPKAPGGDDVAFVQKLLKERILGVPGSGFAGPGHFRLAFCTEEKIILRAAEGFKRAISA